MNIRKISSKQFSSPIILGSLAFCAATTLNGQIIAEYTADGLANGATVTASTVATDANASSLTSSGIDFVEAFSTGATIVNNGSAAATNPLIRARGFSTTFSSSQYFEFSVTPGSGFQFDLDTIIFDFAPGGNSQRDFQVQYSFDGFSTAGIVAGSGGGNVSNSYDRYTFNLQDEDAGNNTTISGVTFRVLAATPSTSNDIRFDNISVNGTVSTIPEPSTLLGLLALAFSSCLIVRKRRNK